MLIIKVYATKEVPLRMGESADLGVTSRVEMELIDEIQIQNVRKRDKDMWEYEIKKPLGVTGMIIHFRDQGYMPLLKKALGLLIGHNPGGTNGG